MTGVSNQKIALPRRIKRALLDFYDFASGRRIERVESEVASLTRRIERGETDAANLTAHLNALSARMTFVERCLGVSVEAPVQSRDDALDKLLDQRLAQLESRLLIIMEGPYLERVQSAARFPAKHASDTS